MFIMTILYSIIIFSTHIVSAGKGKHTRKMNKKKTYQFQKTGHNERSRALKNISKK